MLEETEANRLAFIEKLKKATEARKPKVLLASVSDVKKYEDVELSAEHLLTWIDCLHHKKLILAN